MESSDTHLSDLKADPPDPSDLTGELKLDSKRIVGRGYFSVVYRCICANNEVAVKAIVFPAEFDPVEKKEFVRKVKRELAIWRRLEHSNIVQFLGTANGNHFGSDHPCLVSAWMINGMLSMYVKKNASNLTLVDRIRLINGTVAGLDYLHSQDVIHGDLHPANILIDGEHNACISDFGLSQTLSRKSDQLAYLYTSSIRPGAMLWAAPELLHPEFYPNLGSRATLCSDIYSLGSIILFILSGEGPWRDLREADEKLKEFQNPPRPVNILDDVWDYIRRCWSPQDPRSRPSAREVLSFSTDRLDRLLRLNPASDINTAQFGPSRVDLPDLSDMLGSKRIAGIGSFSVVYRCRYGNSMEVAVKAITPPGIDATEKDLFMRRIRRELAIWRRLDHPNIVLLLGTASGKDFGSDYPCIVATWITNGTLLEYVKRHEARLAPPDRIQLIRGSVSGLEYLHSLGIVHGSLHPANILIDRDHIPCLTDFGLSQNFTLPQSIDFGYLRAKIRAIAVLWAAPELLYPGLYPNPVTSATSKSDIYSLSSIIFLILSGKGPWEDIREAENRLREFQNPSRPVWPVIMPDGVWDFIEQCWSPRNPENRPSAQDVLSFSTDRLERLLLPDPVSDINVVLFGGMGSGKSSIINLLANEEIAQIGSGMEHCTKRPTWFQISIDEVQFRLWDTVGFSLTRQPPSPRLLPYECAHSVLRNLSDGVNIILLCVHKDQISSSLGGLYWLLSDLFYGGRAPIILVVTHSDTPASDSEWWEHNKHDIAHQTGIPITTPHACVTMDATGCGQSKRALKGLLRTYAAAVSPTPLRLDPSSYPRAVSDLTTHCGLRESEATALVKRFRMPPRRFNVVFFGETGVGMSPIVHLISGKPVMEAIPSTSTSTGSYDINTGMQLLRIWDATHIDRSSYMGALESTCQIIRHLSGEGGVDLLVFFKRSSGGLTPEELNQYRLVEEMLCKGQSPVAVITIYGESLHPEKGCKMHGRDLIKSIGGNVVNHVCIPPPTGQDSNGIRLDKTPVESRLSIEAMLEGCVTSRSARLPSLGTGVKGVLSIFPFPIKPLLAWRRILRRKKMTIKNLTGCFGLAKEEAEKLLQLYNG